VSDTTTASRKTRAVKALPSPRQIQALVLLRKIGKGRYASNKWVPVVEHMIERAELGIMADTFDAEKKVLREWLRAQSMPKAQGKRKNEGQLPSPVTFNKVIKSLEPIYQELRKTMSS
jgi:hypothetical protein